MILHANIKNLSSCNQFIGQINIRPTCLERTGRMIMCNNYTTCSTIKCMPQYHFDIHGCKCRTPLTYQFLFYQSGSGIQKENPGFFMQQIHINVFEVFEYFQAAVQQWSLLYFLLFPSAAKLQGSNNPDGFGLSHSLEFTKIMNIHFGQ